jgi:hypothetical protein
LPERAKQRIHSLGGRSFLDWSNGPRRFIAFEAVAEHGGPFGVGHIAGESFSVPPSILGHRTFSEDAAVSVDEAAFFVPDTVMMTSRTSPSAGRGSSAVVMSRFLFGMRRANTGRRRLLLALASQLSI